MTDPQADTTVTGPALDAALMAAIAETGTLARLLDRQAARFGAGPMLVAPSVLMPADPDGLATTSFAEMAARSSVLARGLYQAGIRPGEALGVLATNMAITEAHLVQFAAARLGAVLVPLNPRYGDEDLDHALALSDVRMVIAETALMPRLAAARARCGRGFVCVDAAAADGLQALLAAGDAVSGQSWAAPTPSDTADLIFTSGTTGRPKAVVHTQGSAVATGAIFGTALTLGPGDIHHHAVPFFTSSGVHFNPLAALWAGATMIVEPAFDADAILNRIAARRSTVLLSVPSGYLYILDALERRGDDAPDLSSIRIWNYGGAAMPQEAVIALAKRFPDVDQRQNYGMTETGPTGTMLQPDEVLSHPGSVGRPMPLCRVRITDEAGRPQPAGRPGEIEIASPANMAGYHGDATATAATLCDGWVRTGDWGMIDDDGHLHHLDRLKDVIVRGGLKIAARRVEEVLHRVPGVFEAAVIALPHPRLGEDVAAVIVRGRTHEPAPAIDETDQQFIARLTAAARAVLADYETPRRIFITDALPRNPLGKVLKTELRRCYALAMAPNPTPETDPTPDTSPVSTTARQA
ncbi:class I adenylate-forming enzyme family protein (plasmid) [Tistrella bauzanensis]|uniref:class I adenylate-forming enzyme family protein n=1 Tax=Tistrella TaxID=171436 RepID=UPI0031F68657